MFNLWITLAVASILVSLMNSQAMFEEISMKEKYGAYDFNFGYHEGPRQWRDMQKNHHRDFRQHRERTRRPHEWGLGTKLMENAISLGEMYCRHEISFGSVTEEKGGELELKIHEIVVKDDRTHEEYPVIVYGHDFISYIPKLRLRKKNRFFTITIKYTGCHQISTGCMSVSTLKSSYHPGQEKKFIPINFAYKYYTEECSWLRRVFNFWPFSYFF